MQRPCSHKSLSNQEQLEAVKEKKSEECRSDDGHLDRGIHSRNVLQKEVITFSKLWEEEEA